MKLIPVEAVPKRRGRHHLQDLIEEFVRGGRQGRTNRL